MKKSRKSSRKGPGRKGYSPEMKAKVLATAKKEKLTGAQVAKRFGIATLTFYKWRGPVRGKKAKGGPGRSKGSGSTVLTPAAIRRIVRAEMKKLLRKVVS